MGEDGTRDSVARKAESGEEEKGGGNSRGERKGKNKGRND